MYNSAKGKHVKVNKVFTLNCVVTVEVDTQPCVYQRHSTSNVQRELTNT